ncbi:ABC transporter substrate-binding protein [Xinfangfangia sp. CPCC 101601]|uniref:ABC transporter substrate-binding protein n=1 Tax=Pseudogemmobacter lacusdianii TaxID=3069608 RepID=A0ABU0W1S2_9RHOB|nr:ABC transporter substrate-binding protein [Xinfangfangia sp. CPCC 101601]MDQ2067977.1 ABC transporter substrate-binding protein [Xinfangfangia sp. CPCC 101601]
MMRFPKPALMALALANLGLPALAESQERLIALGGSVTEIVVLLGEEGRLVARDSTSTYPPSVEALPDVGYIRALSPENVLALNPALIIADGDAGPPAAVEVLQSAGIPFAVMPVTHDADGIPAKITAVGQALGKPEEGATLAASVSAGLEAAKIRAAAVPVKKKVLFLLSMNGGKLMAGGEGSSAEGIIELAGGENAAVGFQGYKPITDEAIIAAAPDVILMMDREGDLAAADAEVVAHPALGETPAGKTGAIIRMDGLLLLGFGPRTPEAAEQLYQALYGVKG